MAFLQGKCPNCGGFLAVDNTKDAAVCPFCDTPFISEKAIHYYNITNNVNVGAGAVVNVMGGSQNDFDIVAGELKQYNGSSMDVVIPDTVKTIGDKAFSGLSNLTSIVIPDGVTRIGNNALSGCTGLTSVTIPGSVKSIGSSAFQGCSGLTSIKIPDSVTEIGSSAFNDCAGLKTAGPIGGGYNIEFDRTTNIPARVFFGCTDLTSITIPGSVKSIGEKAFWGCTGLTSVTIPDSVTSIGIHAFSCKYLKTVTLGQVMVDKLLRRDSNIILAFSDTPFLTEFMKQHNRCTRCGGEFKGVFTKKCAGCGREKDY